MRILFIVGTYKAGNNNLIKYLPFKIALSTDLFLHQGFRLKNNSLTMLANLKRRILVMEYIKNIADDFIEGKDTVFIELSSLAINQRESIETSNIPLGIKVFILTTIDQSQKVKNIKDNDLLVAWRSDILANLASTKNKLSKPKTPKALKTASLGLFSIRIKEMEDLGVSSGFIYTSASTKKRIYHYKIDSFVPVFQLIYKNDPEIKGDSTEKRKGNRKKRLSANMIAEQRDLFSDTGGIMIGGKKEEINNIILYQEQMINGILDTCMRVSKSDKRNNISVNYYIKGEPLKITSSCSTEDNMELLMLSDQRALRGVISYCKKEVEHMKLRLKDVHGSSYHPRLIPNLFHLLVDDLCRLMDLQPTTTNIRSVVGMLTRLNDTQFSVDASENSWFKDNFSMMFGEDEFGQRIQSDKYRIRILTNLETAPQNKLINAALGENINPRFFTFSLENRLFLSLISDSSTNLFLSHKQLSSERSGIIQRFYNWAKGKFAGGGSRHNLEKKWFNGREIMLELIPHEQRYDNFIAYFTRSLRKEFFLQEKGCYFKKDQGRSLVYGFYVNYKKQGKEHYFQIQRDRNDEIVGDNSPHKKHIRKTQELLGEY